VVAQVREPVRRIEGGFCFSFIGGACKSCPSAARCPSLAADGPARFSATCTRCSVISRKGISLVCSERQEGANRSGATIGCSLVEPSPGRTTILTLPVAYCCLPLTHCDTNCDDAQGLNELQAYLLLYRSPALQQAGSTQKLSLEQLHDLQHAYFLQRSYLLSSIHELLSQQNSAEVYQRSATTALSHALDAGLDKSLCRALAVNLAEGRSDTSHDTSAIPAGTSSALVLSTSQHPETQSQQGKQQLLFEREMLLSTLLCMFADWKPCTPDCFQQLMCAMHQHMRFSWHTDKESGAVTSRALQLVSVINQRLSCGSCKEHNTLHLAFCINCTPRDLVSLGRSNCLTCV